MNNQAINHDIYAEINNGLFFVKEIIFGVDTDDPEEFTFKSREIQIVPRQDIGISDQIEQHQPIEYSQIITRQHLEEVVDSVFGSRNTTINFSSLNFREEPERRENERLNRFHNMSEQEILNYLDQISQEE